MEEFRRKNPTTSIITPVLVMTLQHDKAKNGLVLHM